MEDPTPRQEASSAIEQTAVVDRRAMKRHIKVLLARGINVRGYMIRARSARLRHVSTVIEYQLYKVAATYDQYSDLITLEERMAGVVTAYFLHQRQRRGGGADGGSAAAVAPPLGAM